MNEILNVRLGSFSQNYSGYQKSGHQKIQSSQPASEPQSLPGNNLPLMVSIFYIAPITLLIVMGLTTYLKRKLKVGKEIKQLGHIAQLERILSLKQSEKINS